MNSYLIIPLEKEKFILIKERLSAINMTQAEVDHYVAQLSIDSDPIVETQEGKVIRFEHLDEISSIQQQKDIDITSVVNGGYSIDTISLKNVEDRDRCIEAIYAHIEKNYTNTVGRQKLYNAALLPLLCIGAVVIIGGFISLCGYYFQEPTGRTQVVKKSVYIFYQIAKFIGPTIPMVITGILLVISLLFLIKNLSKRPLMIMIEKKK